MRPSFPNQNQVDRSSNAVHHQGLLTNLSTPNVGAPSPCLSYGHNNPSMNLQSLVQVPLLPFNGAFAQLGAFNGSGTALPGPHVMQVAGHHRPMPNSHLFSPPMVSSSPQNLNKPRGKVYQQNTLQNMNSIAANQQYGVLHNFPQNFNQTVHSVPPSHLFAHGSQQVTNQPRPLHQHGSASTPGGQCGSLNRPMNQFSNFPLGPLFQQPIIPQFGAFNMPPLVGCSNQNPPFPLNPQSTTVYSNQVVQQNITSQQMFMPSIGQNGAQDLPIAVPNIQMNALASVNSGPVQKQETEKNSEPLPIHGPQVYQPGNKNNTSNFNLRNHQNKFSNSHHGNEKRKFQKSNPHHSANGKGNFRQFGGKGDRVRKSQMDRSAEQGEVKNRRSVSLNYSEQEIQQWRDERKKNYPSKSNVEKKLAKKIVQPGEVDNDGQRRRQELRDILAKQAELGVEVAELPQNYLSDSNDQPFKKTEENGMCSDNSRFQNKKGRFRNKYGKRQKHGKVNGFVKRQKFGDNEQSTQHSLNKKKATLLQKLLTTDIKRDKVQLLQALRLMVMNSFFKHWPDKPLDFPQVTVGEGVSYKVESTEEKPSECRGREDVSQIDAPPVFEACEDLKDHGATMDDDEESASEDLVDGDMDEIDSVKDEMDNSGGEEGEITD
ncbi:hypothetical protein Scep_003109 [Stephania cephalantha]|uniref:FMR1-interacting protein 1 conserved domain-containing protein n=1 Tax=Stephania cephalantha TaxID=152367 RepID=A0AAP0PVJ3_9MAGN